MKVEARLSVSPPFLTEKERHLTAIDLSLNATGRQWFVDSLKLPFEDSVLHYYVDSSKYSVLLMLVVNNEYCSDTAVVSVPVKIQSLWFPNVFTPGEASNNLFRGYGVNVRDYDLKIFTRWGDCIFHTNDINECWNGTYRGVPSPASAYVYLCRYTTLDGEPRTVAGTVTLIR